TVEVPVGLDASVLENVDPSIGDDVRHVHEVDIPVAHRVVLGVDLHGRHAAGTLRGPEVVDRPAAGERVVRPDLDRDLRLAAMQGSELAGVARLAGVSLAFDRTCHGVPPGG